MDRTVGTSGRQITRRGVLAGGSLGLGALASGSLLAGCNNDATATRGKVISSSQLKKVLPDYIPSKAATPDLAGGDGVDPGFTRFPAQLTQSVPKTPGTGSSFQSMMGTFAITPPANNSYYQAVNKALGADISFQEVPAVSYVEKVAAVLASRKIPDTITLWAWDLPKDVNQAAPALFADLTPFLAGEAIKAYPNLANIPSSVWSNALFNGRLYALPVAGARFGQCFFYRKDILKQLGLVEPTNADEWLTLAKALTSTKDHRWASGDPTPLAKQVFGAPDDWRKSANGKLEKTEETDEFAAAVEFSRKFYKAGYVHPDVVSGNANTKDLFGNGRMVMYMDGFGAWTEALRVNRPANPAFDMQALKPFAHDGGTPIGYADGGPVYFTVLNKNLPKSKIQEFLRIADYLAAPFGTKECNLLSYGVEGVHYKMGKDGSPVLTPEGAKYAGNSYGVLLAPPVFLYDATYPDHVTSAHSWEESMEKVKVTSPIYGLHVTIPAQIAALQQKLDDTVNSILRGRAQMSDLKSAVQQWRTSGGEDLRRLYENAI